MYESHWLVGRWEWNQQGTGYHGWLQPITMPDRNLSWVANSFTTPTSLYGRMRYGGPCSSLTRCSQSHKMWMQSLHYRHPRKTGDNIIGLFKTSLHRRFINDRCYSYWLLFLTSFASFTYSTTHSEDNLVRTTYPLARLLCSLNMRVHIGVQWVEDCDGVHQHSTD